MEQGWNFGWGNCTTIPDDRDITEDVVYVFTRGHCHSFAVAASEILNCPIIEIDDGSLHYAVDMGYDMWLDIRGVQSREDMLEVNHFLPGDETQWREVMENEITDNPDMADLRVDDARPWAQLVIDREGINV